MNAPSVDIKDMLEADSALGLAYKTNLFIGREPSKPIDTVTIFDFSVRKPSISLDKQNYYYTAPQIRVKSNNYVDGWNLIDSIMNSLQGRANETWNGTLYTLIQVASGPMLFDWQDNGPVRFIINLNVQRR
jgi:hypothetical protein